MFRVVLSSLMVCGIVTLAGCGGDGPTSPTTPPAPPQPPPETFTISVVPRTAPGNVVFFPMFGSGVGIAAAPTTVVVDAQRSPAGSLSGGWSSTPASGVIGLAQGGLSAQATATGAGDATITFRDNRGPSGSFVLRSAPKFDAGITIVGNTNTVSGDCIDTTPPGTTSICTDAGDVGLGQKSYSFTLTSTATGTPPVVTVSGSFTDGAFALNDFFTISNAPTINPQGTFTPSGQVNSAYMRPGFFAPPRVAIPITVRED